MRAPARPAGAIESLVVFEQATRVILRYVEVLFETAMRYPEI